MNESVQYWIPRGLPDYLQVALSIPGKPPKTLEQHRNRLEALLMTLAEEAEENLGAGGTGATGVSDSAGSNAVSGESKRSAGDRANTDGVRPSDTNIPVRKQSGAGN